MPARSPWCDTEAVASLDQFTVRQRTPIAGPDGEFEMVALATFFALGATFVVLVECKHHRNRIKRELRLP